MKTNQTEKNKIIQKAHQFLKEIHYDLSISQLCQYAQKLGWEVFYYNGENDHGDRILHFLQLSEYAQQQNGFYYHSNTHNFIFLRANLQKETTQSLLLHELGHILLEHPQQSFQYKEQTIEQENQANFFALYILSNAQKPNFLFRQTHRHKKIIISALLITFLFFVFCCDMFFFSPRYYTTPTGTKYHNIHCIYIQNHSLSQAKSLWQVYQEGYGACQECILK